MQVEDEVADTVQSHTLSEFLRALQDVFSREPPVIAKQQPPRSPQVGGPPPRPPLPAELRQDVSRPASTISPPPPPPKPFQQTETRPNEMPPVPPRPPIQATSPRPQSQAFNPQGQWNQSRPQSQYIPQQTTQPIPYPQNAQMRPGYAVQNQQWNNNIQPSPQIPPQNTYSPSNIQSQGRHVQPALVQPQPQYSQPFPQQPPQQIPKKPEPVQDLLTSPFDPPLPTHSINIPAPPIPPNPEKDALLSAISHKLTTQLQSVIASNQGAIQPLSAQHAAMTNVLGNLQQERAALLSLGGLLESNENILHGAMRDADECIASAQHKAIPGVDEVLVAPTVVGQQLYDLVAEEKACADTREVLGRALDRGRISSEMWIKTVRSLAREEFLKKVLIKKCADGMGLQQDGNMV
jgi:ESCRT-I complex subunit TSG101